MSENVISLAASRTGDKDAADYFRALADRLEAGEVRDVVVVFHDNEAAAYERFGSWEDRWRIYGALAYAQAAIDQA